MGSSHVGHLSLKLGLEFIARGEDSGRGVLEESEVSVGGDLASGLAWDAGSGVECDTDASGAACDAAGSGVECDTDFTGIDVTPGQCSRGAGAEFLKTTELRKRKTASLREDRSWIGIEIGAMVV